MATSADRKSAQKKAAQKRPQTWKKGQSGNPKGGPKRGQSWAEIIRELGDLDGPTVAERAGAMAADFRKMPSGITLKELVALRVYHTLTNDPSPGLLNAFMERAEGKVMQPIEQTVRETVFDYGTVIARIAPGSDEDSETPGDDQSDSLRA